MDEKRENKINARGLSARGAKMMVETVLEKGPCRSVRVVVSSAGAADGLTEFFNGHGASVKTDQIGDDFHVFAEFEEG